MPILSAERSFDQGLMALAEGRHLDAVQAFRSAVEIERQRDVRFPSSRLLSYYGLSLALAGGSSQEALDACRTAVEREPSKPVYLLNLGRVYLAAGRREQAHACFLRGVALAPDHRPLLEELARLERGARPARLTGGRAQVLERMLGRARAGWPRPWLRRRSA